MIRIEGPESRFRSILETAAQQQIPDTHTFTLGTKGMISVPCQKGEDVTIILQDLFEHVGIPPTRALAYRAGVVTLETTPTVMFFASSQESKIELAQKTLTAACATQQCSVNGCALISGPTIRQIRHERWEKGMVTRKQRAGK